MSGSQDSGTDTASRAKTTTLSRHWQVAVLAAAGFATMVGGGGTAAYADSAEAKPASASRDDDQSSSQDKATHGGKGRDSGARGDKGKGQDSDHHGRARKHGHDDDRGRVSHEGNRDKARSVECDPDDLISAIVRANEVTGPGHLELAKDCTYTLTANTDGNGLPTVTQPITIIGNGATITRAANADDFRIFEVQSGGDLKLRNLTITRGKAADDNGGAINVRPAGRVDLEKVTLEDNTVSDVSSYEGGGVYNEGITAIRDSTLHTNFGHEGAAVSSYYGKAEISRTKVTGNISDGYAAIVNEYGTTKISESYLSYNYGYYGGALNNYGGVTEVEKSALTHNLGYYGGGIYNQYGSLFVRDSTVKDNTATDGGGGGLNLTASAVIEDSRILDNTATNSSGGGISVELDDDELGVAIRDSKIAGNQAPGNGSNGGGVFVGVNSLVTLTDSKVKGNISDEPAGGVHNDGTVVTNGKVRIIDNVPTNCDGSTNPVPNCFG
ncbi:right-handed parallel beta-helix repeat-containing protein [Streptomyces sp. NPDC019396]|uniref:right-handed parallel beta-helix repeat-containing protein n=1 Tax=Streptomyces sp. NPDC019396 TaxID=3154687 RepID=UPI0034063FEF